MILKLVPGIIGPEGVTGIGLVPGLGLEFEGPSYFKLSPSCHSSHPLGIGCNKTLKSSVPLR